SVEVTNHTERVAKASIVTEKLSERTVHATGIMRPGAVADLGPIEAWYTEWVTLEVELMEDPPLLPRHHRLKSGSRRIEIVRGRFAEGFEVREVKK
ncbi:MAG: hypothetical protein KDA28_02780, partial [Phycisphaerales bacterium]|nr:hypothetical protein [Phycisphaerales bacterium]